MTAASVGIAALLALSVAMSVPVLLAHAVAVLAEIGSIHGLQQLVLAIHVAAGVPSIFLGAAALWLRPGRTLSRRHRWLGRCYLVSGGVNAAAGLVISVARPHGPPGLYVATGTVALAWLACAAMGYRAIRNGRTCAHREWMTRTYVLTWTFVGCRIVQGATLHPGLGPDGITALVWLDWVVPLGITQIVLEWRRAGRRPMALRRPAR